MRLVEKVCFFDNNNYYNSVLGCLGLYWVRVHTFVYVVRFLFSPLNLFPSIGYDHEHKVGKHIGLSFLFSANIVTDSGTVIPCWQHHCSAYSFMFVFFFTFTIVCYFVVTAILFGIRTVLLHCNKCYSIWRCVVSHYME